MPLTAYAEMFPEFTPSCYQQDLILAAVTDMDAWDATLKFWKGNAHRPQSILTMLDYYSKYKAPPSGDWIADTIKAHPHIDARLVEIAVIQTLLTTQAKVAHVNYFHGPVEQLHSDLKRGEDKMGITVSSGLIGAILLRRQGQYGQRIVKNT